MKITDSQKQQIAALRGAGKSHRQIAKQLDLKLGTVKTIIYSNRPPSTAPVVKARNGQFKSAAPRQGPGRRPANGIEAASDKARAAAYRARKRAQRAELTPETAADSDLAAMLTSAMRKGDTRMVNAIVSELHGRHCAIL